MVYLFGSIIRSNALCIKDAIDTFETDIKDIVQTNSGQIKQGSAVNVGILAVRLKSISNTANRARRMVSFLLLSQRTISILSSLK